MCNAEDELNDLQDEFDDLQKKYQKLLREYELPESDEHPEGRWIELGEWEELEAKTSMDAPIWEKLQMNNSHICGYKADLPHPFADRVFSKDKYGVDNLLQMLVKLRTEGVEVIQISVDKDPLLLRHEGKLGMVSPRIEEETSDE